MADGWYALSLGLRVAALSAAAALLLAPVPAWLLATREFGWKRPLVLASAFLALVPAVILGYLLLPAFPWQVAAAVSLLQSVPYLLRAASAAFAAQPRQYRDAALVAGAPEWRILFRVAIPLAGRPILTAALGVFVFTPLEFAAVLAVAQRLRGPS